jgi:hypothetical protein
MKGKTSDQVVAEFKSKGVVIDEKIKAIVPQKVFTGNRYIFIDQSVYFFWLDLPILSCTKN